MKTYLFCDLSASAKVYAMNDYLKGWEETHEKGDLTKAEVYDILGDNDEFLFDVEGRFLSDCGEEE